MVTKVRKNADAPRQRAVRGGRAAVGNAGVRKDATTTGAAGGNGAPPRASAATKDGKPAHASRPSPRAPADADARHAAMPGDASGERPAAAVGTTRARAATAVHATTAMQVADDLRQRILRGEFAPGERLKIDDIAALCQVSHMPVRVALQELESEGVLDLYPHRGAVIRAVDARFVRNMLELRSSIEVMLTERCARLIDKAGITALDRLARDFEQAAARNAPQAIVAANLRLHDAINRVADNPEALQVLGRGRLLIQALRVRYGFGPGRVATVIAEHHALVRAITRHDERRAGEIARRHCEGARDELLALLP